MAQSLEQLAVQQEAGLLHQGPWKVYFETGAPDIDWDMGLRGERLKPTWLTGVAKLLRQHPTLRAEVSGHTSTRAPRMLAGRVTRARAAALAAELELLGVEMDRIRRRGWSMSVAPLAGWTPGHDTAVAELFLVMSGMYIPSRPLYYAAAEAASGDRTSGDEPEARDAAAGDSD